MDSQKTGDAPVSAGGAPAGWATPFSQAKADTSDGVILWDRQEPDVSHCTPEAAAFFKSYFSAKHDGRVDDLIDHYHDDVVMEDMMPLRLAPKEDMRAAWKQFYPMMAPNVGPTLIRVLGDMNSAVFDYVNDPMVYQGTCHTMSLIVLRDGKILRHADYTDGRHFGLSSAYIFRSMGAEAAKTYPLPPNYAIHTDVTHASPLIRDVARRIGEALGEGRARDAAAMFTEDGVYNDWTLDTSIRGRDAIEQHFAEFGAKLPNGTGSRFMPDVLGNDLGGGFRWRTRSLFQKGLPYGGASSLELRDGRVERMDTLWDSCAIASSLLKDMRPRGAPRAI